MDVTSDLKARLGKDWIPAIYADKVRSQRTRSYSPDVPEKENAAEIFYTLLGIELKVGNKRFACPDLATARYLRTFARIGCREFAIPYDVSRISVIADELETAWQRLLLLIELRAKGTTAQARGRLRSTVLRSLRKELADIGAGEMMPSFKQSTKQRS